MYVSLGAGTALNNANPASLDFTLVNKSLPWDYDFRFVIEEISSINDKEQVERHYNESAVNVSRTNQPFFRN